MDALLIWALLFFIFSGFSGLYFLYMKNKASKPWNLNIDMNYKPSLTILVPMYNEEKTIKFKLENLVRVAYPPDRIETLLVNDASTDRTLEEVTQFVRENPSMNIKVLNRQRREGKTSSLNFALNHATGDIIVVSDADCFWPPDVLMKTLPLLSDQNVGAVAARELLLNTETSLSVKGELFYDKSIQLIRIGESKVHSTLIFQGGFNAFKRAILDEFDKDDDDSGTAFNLVQKNKRTLLASDAYFYTVFPSSWRNKIIVKVRRANQLQRIWARCLKLLVRRRLILPKRIALPEIFLHIFNPVLFFALIFTTVFVILKQPILLAAFLLMVPLMLVPKSRTAITEIAQNNFILLFAMAGFLKKGAFRIWKPVQESRILVDRKILQQNNLV
jgi:cellulose synthase/poly-beta-1,6-N-acetylglucosamine synthase-like glycosyltransferase